MKYQIIDQINGLVQIDSPKNGTFKGRGWLPCVCGGTIYVVGHFATGETLLSGYTPPANELVKNNTMICESCGFEQYS